MTSERLPLLSGQRDIWFGHLLDQTGCAYNTGLYTEISGDLDLTDLNAAATYVVGKTDALRLRFHAADDALWQQVGDPGACRMPVFDVTRESAPRAAGIELIHQQMRTGFQLDAEPPFRWLAIKTGESRWLWGQIYHHIVLDGQSAWIVSSRVAETYSALREGRALPEYPDGGMAALVREEHAYRSSSRCRDDRRYWETVVGVSERMTSWSRRARSSGDDSVVRESCYLPTALLARLRDMAAATALRPEYFLMAAAAVLQSACQGQQDIMLGSQLLGRLGSSARAFPAMASNECHLKLVVAPALTMEALANAISRQLRLALRHQSYRYEELRNDLGLLPGEPDYFGLSVNIMSVDADLPFAGLRSSSNYLSFGPVRDLSLTLFHNKAHGQLRLDLDGNGALYRRADLQAHLARIVFLVEQGLTEAVPIGALTLFSASDFGQTLAADVRETADQPPTLPDLIAATITTCPEKIAVICNDRTLSYDELDRRSNQLARYLIHRGIGPDGIVAIGLPRGLNLLVAVLAVLKAGAGCLTLDLQYPADRLSHMIEDSGAILLLTERDGATTFAARTIPMVVMGDGDVESLIAGFNPGAVGQQERTAPLLSDDIAFLIYTSGSTGKPKGVGLTHRNLVHKLTDQRQLWSVGSSSRFALSSSINFDPSIHQMLLPLVAGGTCIVLVAEQVNDPDRFMQAVARAAVTHLDVVPAFAAVIADHSLIGLPNLEVFILGGEVLAAPLLSKLRQRLPHCRLFNMYGPTETCIDATAFEISADWPADEPIPIGRALSNYHVHILDACLRPLPQGIIGEIYISGVGVARGYWRQPRMTAERFLACPFGAPGERMYRTGDRGYRNGDGNLVFCGRQDEQVKLRGVRIELAEIESVLLREAGVIEAAVALEEIGEDRRLVAYVVAAAGIALAAPTLRAGLAESLPDFMIPSAIVIVESMPRLANGKLDRKSLPKVAQDDVVDHVEPATDLEAQLCVLFGRLTGAARVSLLDNFFQLGGHSLLVMRLVSRLRTDHGHDVPIELVFTHPTPKSLAAAISARATRPSEYGPIVRLRDAGALPPLFCIHPAAGLARVYGPMLSGIDARIPVYGLQARGIDDAAPLHASIPEMARAYVDAVRNVQPAGPYRLMGWSFGGVVAQAMAGLLESKGEDVRLFLIDSYFSNVIADTEEAAHAARSMIGLANMLPEPGQDRAGEPLLERIETAFVHSARLLADHTPQRNRGPVTFFRATDNVDADLRSSLQAITSGAIVIEQAGAGHYALFDSEHAAETGAALNRHLIESTGQGGQA